MELGVGFMTAISAYRLDLFIWGKCTGELSGEELSRYRLAVCRIETEISRAKTATQRVHRWRIVERPLGRLIAAR